MKIPKKLKLFGYEIEVKMDDKLKYEKDCVGIAEFHRNRIVLQSNNIEKPLLNVQIEKHFLHELIHFILYMMGENDLTYNEKFVDMFARLLQQALETMEY